MTTGSYNESSYEKAVLVLHAEEGWRVEYGPDIERDYSDPMLADAFTFQVRKLNRNVPAEAVDDAIRQVRSIGGERIATPSLPLTPKSVYGILPKNWVKYAFEVWRGL